MIHLGLVKRFKRAIDPGAAAIFFACTDLWRQYLDLKLQEHELQNRDNMLND
jgi:hypothetical protein